MINWEFEAPQCLLDAHQKAQEFIDSLLKDSQQEFSVHLDLTPCKGRPTNIRHKEYKPGYVLSKIRMDAERVPFKVGSKTFDVKMNSQRYWLFKDGRHCASCGLEGTKMVLETLPDGSNPHFNLYGVENGKTVLFTKDHIKAKAIGGTDSMDNYVVLCAPCNQLKASYSISYEAVNELRKLLKNQQHLSRRELNRLIHERRLLLLDSLDGQ